MEREAIIERIRGAVATVLGHNAFEMREYLNAAGMEGWDPFTGMTIITDLEKAFDDRSKLRGVNKPQNMGPPIELVTTKLAP